MGLIKGVNRMLQLYVIICLWNIIKRVRNIRQFLLIIISLYQILWAQQIIQNELNLKLRAPLIISLLLSQFAGHLVLLYNDKRLFAKSLFGHSWLILKRFL